MGRSAPCTGARRVQLGLSCFALLFVACAPEFEKLEKKRSPRGTLGEEVYKVLCRRVAGTELPQDLDGRESEVLCLGDAEAAADELEARRAELPPRLVALAERREQVARAVDDVFTDELADDLELLMRELLPFYDPPEERIQNNTRAFAALLRQMSANPAAMRALTKVGREGMVSREGSFGLYRGLLGYDDLNRLLSELLPLLSQSDVPGNVRADFGLLLTGMALDFATAELDDEPDSGTRWLKELMARSRPEFGSSAVLPVARRDARGMPIPTPRGDVKVPFPFVDADGDGLADEKDGRFVTDPRFAGELPEPFPTLSERGVQRDEYGRAYAFTEDGQVDTSRLLYETFDADVTVLAGMLRELGKLFLEDTQVAVHLAKLAPALFGERVDTQRTYGALNFSYRAPDGADSALVDLVHAAGAIVEHPLYDRSLELTERLLASEEPALVQALTPLLALERRTRAADDAYPEAKLEESTFWDELFAEAERVVRRRKTKDSPTMLELLLRGALGYTRNLDKPGAPLEQLVDPNVLRHQGALMAALMRYKDEWRNNPKGESEREPGEPLSVGGFRIPVDRTKPSTPVTCGRDGCGGLVAGTPYERWARPGQNCMIQRDGRPASSKDCGAPANQSIFHRSLGLIWEMAGRDLCNKPITLGDLLDFAVLKDPCLYPKTALDKDAAEVPCTTNDECVVAYSSTDYECDTSRHECVARRPSPSCTLLQQQQRQERQNTIVEAENYVATDYACPADVPDAPCHAYADKYPAAFVDPDGPGTGAPSTLLGCHLLDIDDVGRAFGRALTHEFRIEIPNPWVRRYLEDVARAGLALPNCGDIGYDIVDPTVTPPCITQSAKLSRDTYDNMPAEVDTLGELIEFLLDDSELFQNDADTADLRPESGALTRVLFAPPGSSTFVTLDPLLVRGAPKACSEAPGLPACSQDDTAETPPGGCCIEDLRRPPLRYRLDTYYGNTAFAWEYRMKFSDGTSLSMLDVMKALADAVNQTDFDPETDDPDEFEGTDFIFSTLGKLVGHHYDSSDNPLAQNRDPNLPHYRSLAGLVRYESLLADALDDGTVDRTQLGPAGEPLFDEATLPSEPERQLGLVYHSYPLLERIAALDFGGRDGISLSADIAELLLSPHAFCAPEGGDLRVVAGKGACDRAAAGEPGYRGPLTYRDGRAYICWNDGRCFDKDDNRRYPSPLYLLLDAIGKVEDRIDALDAQRGDVPWEQTLDYSFDRARAGLFDTYLTVEDGLFADRRLRALLLAGFGYFRDRWAYERDAGTLSTFGRRMTDDTVEVVESPALAGLLGVLEGLSDHDKAMAALNRYGRFLFGSEGGEGQLRALVAGLADALESLPGDEDLMELTRTMALGILPNADALVREGGDVDTLERGLIWRNLELARESVAKDEKGVLGKVVRNLMALPDDARAVPFSALAEAVLAINRYAPGRTLGVPEAHGPMSSEDWQNACTRIADVMQDERRGFERLYKIVQCREGSTEDVMCE
jgi:hypothetical protein